jgi:beta-phosphoglucomutase-like phosphatase (HAD superfamily)
MLHKIGLFEKVFTLFAHESKTFIKAVHFDLDSILIHPLSSAPLLAFSNTFKQKGIILAKEQITSPIRNNEHTHINLILEKKPVIEQWKAKHGRKPSTIDANNLYKLFKQELGNIIDNSTNIILDAHELLHFLSKTGIKIGFTTEHSHTQANRIAAKLLSEFKQSVMTTSDQVKGGPIAMIKKNNEALGLKTAEINQTIFFTSVGSNILNIRPNKKYNTPHPWIIGVTGNKRYEKVEYSLIENGAHATIRFLKEAHFVIEAVVNALKRGKLPENTSFLSIDYPVSAKHQHHRSKSC